MVCHDASSTEWSVAARDCSAAGGWLIAATEESISRIIEAAVPDLCNQGSCTIRISGSEEAFCLHHKNLGIAK